MGPESKFYQKIKRNFNGFSLSRVENLSSLGHPDVLGYNTNRHFFTIELKVTKSKKVRFSPHQIAFHLRHPKNTFIMVQALGPCTPNTSPISMYRGSRIRELVTSGLKLEACCLSLEACRLMLSELGA
jgi:intracellular sulfur oxidation DsrE/DsrF family protein|tara:strand:+ start:572 stop:955 length:384 start_codon:yes stop_codon:yes gene_type:complete